eukprot:Skav206929  [mRNA]  locus=scaffold1731:128925:136806:- [translate_table: standard]
MTVQIQVLDSSELAGCNGSGHISSGGGVFGFGGGGGLAGEPPSSGMKQVRHALTSTFLIHCCC